MDLGFKGKPKSTIFNSDSYSSLGTLITAVAYALQVALHRLKWWKDSDDLSLDTMIIMQRPIGHLCARATWQGMLKCQLLFTVSS